MSKIIPVCGHITVWRARITDLHDREMVYSKPNTINVTVQTKLRDTLLTRSVNFAVDAMAWGSHYNPSGTFVDSDWAGTTNSGTKGALIQTAVGSIVAKFSGTWSFASTKQINTFQLGAGYTPAAPGVTVLFTSLYQYDTSLETGSTFITYSSGDALITDWSMQVGS